MAKKKAVRKQYAEMLGNGYVPKEPEHKTRYGDHSYIRQKHKTEEEYVQDGLELYNVRVSNSVVCPVFASSPGMARLKARRAIKSRAKNERRQREINRKAMSRYIDYKNRNNDAYRLEQLKKGRVEFHELTLFDLYLLDNQTEFQEASTQKPIQTEINF